MAVTRFVLLNVILLASVTSVLSSASAAFACPADLDPAFGNDGISIAPQALGATYDIAITASGRVLTAGFVDNKPTVYRFTNGGEIDEAFGDGGRVQIDFYGGFSTVVVQEDGRIVAAGDISDPEAGAFHLVVARFDASGNLDQEFGDGGLSFVETGDEMYSRDLLVRSDGVIVVVGQSRAISSTWDSIAVFLTEDGELDTSVGEDTGPYERGIVIVGSFPGSSVATSAVEVEERAIVVSGIVSGTGDGFLAKIDAVGRPHAGFGRRGQRIYASPKKYEEPWRVGTDGQGRIYMSGNTTGFATLSDTRVFVRRVLPDGRRDADYGIHGVTLVRFRRQLAPRGLHVAEDGEVTVPAWILQERDRAFIARLTPDGERDRSFDDNGVKRFRLGAPSQLHQVAVQEDGRILATGALGLNPLLLRLEGGDGDGMCTP